MGAALAPVPAAALSPKADFSVRLATQRRAKRPAKIGRYAIVVRNRAGWQATSIRVCAQTPRARITAARDGGSRKSRTTACWIIAALRAGDSRQLGLTLRAQRPITRKRPVRLTVRIVSGNSKGVTRTLSTRTAKPSRRARRSASGVTPRTARAVPRTVAPSCEGGRRLGIAFVADDSGSMESSDPDVLRGSAIAVGLDQMPDGSVAGATSFDTSSRELFPVSTVDATSRPALKEGIARLSASGQTDYELGFAGAAGQLAQMAPTDRKAVIFLSDGMPTSDGTGEQPVIDAGVPIFTIGFGDADPDVLAGIAARSGGQAFQASSAADLQPIFARVVSSLTCAAPRVTTTLNLEPGASQTVPFSVGLNDGEFRALAAWTGGKMTVTAVRPGGSEMTPSALRSGESFSDNPTYALLAATNPATGGWSLKVSAPPGNTSTVRVSIDVYGKALPKFPPQQPVDVRTQGRRQDPCMAGYPGGASKTLKIFAGKQTNYDRTMSLYLVCSGFGTPVGFELSVGMKCALLTAGIIGVGGSPVVGPNLVALERLCTGVDVLTELQSGNWAGAAGGVGCQWAGGVLGTALGIMAGGAAAPTGPGAAVVGTVVYRAIAGSTAIVCAGVFSGDFQRYGEKLQSDHEGRIARDVVSNGKCIRMTERFSNLFWSAADCG